MGTAAEMTLEERIAFGDEAGRLLNSPVLNTAINTHIKDKVNELLTAPVGSQQATEIHAALKGLNALKEQLVVFKNDAAVARKEWEKQRRAQAARS